LIKAYGTKEHDQIRIRANEWT
ncbi:bacterial extracellular solute-binding s, 3 family protein, partial [Vibrio harveyi]